MLAADPGTFRLLTLNTWLDRFKPDASQISNFLINGNYDVMAFQELRDDSTYSAQIPGILSGAGLGTYTSNQTADVGVTYRLPGTSGNVALPDGGPSVSYVTLDEQNGLPSTIVGSVHLNYYDESNYRIDEAKALNQWAAGANGPLIIVGDFNAGDVSERGLHNAQQQAYLYARVITDKDSSDLWKNLASEYTPKGREAEFQAYVDSMRAVDSSGSAHYRSVIQAYFDAHRDDYPSNYDSISSMTWREWEEIVAKDMASKGLTFNDETYPVADNTPQTLNILKKQYMLLQNPSEREPFAPHTLTDGSTTWPSHGEDATNVWTSWDRVKIDHFLVSRPYGKWWTLADSPSDPYLGVLDGVGYANDGTTTTSDHEPVAHTMKWIGPALEKYTSGGTDKTRLVWGNEAPVFQDKDKVFYLTRNNMRTDLYLGQISDDNGMPLLTGLTDAEKKTLLNCKSTDPRFQQAIQDYCIDDHSFIGETLVKDGGTVIVDEDAALGTSAATLRLDNGKLTVAGTAMTSLDRSVVLESGGGTIDIDDPTNKVTMGQVISGTGALTKAGAGTLNLTGDNTYTGQTLVEDGRLAVNGSIKDSVLTTVGNGGTLGGNGTVGDLVVASGGKVAPGNSVGHLTAGNVTLQSGSVYEAEVDNTGHADLLTSSGAITIDSGARLQLVANSNYRLLTNYALLSSTAGITGQFDSSIVSDFAFLSPSLAYSASGVSFQVNRNGAGFASVGTTRNRVAAAGGVESLGSGNALYDAVLSLNASTADQAFRQVSGEIYPSIVGALAEDSRFVRDAVEQRLSGVKARANTADQAGQGVSDYQAWSQGFGSKGSTDGSGVDSLDRRTGGLLMGGDGMLSDKLRLGFFGGYGRSSFSENGQSAHADADSYLAGFYGSSVLDAVRLSFGGSLGVSSISVDRDVAFSSFSNSLHSDYTAMTAQLFGEAAYRVDLGQATIEPFAGLAQVHVSTNGFHEDGGAAALSVDGDGYDLTYTNVGLRAATSLDLNGTTVRLKGEAAWRHAFGDVTPEASTALAGGSAFDVRGASAARDTAVVKAGIDVDLTKDSTAFINYVGEFASGGPDHGVNAGFKLKF